MSYHYFVCLNFFSFSFVRFSPSSLLWAAFSFIWFFSVSSWRYLFALSHLSPTASIITNWTISRWNFTPLIVCLCIVCRLIAWKEGLPWTLSHVLYRLIKLTFWKQKLMYRPTYVLPVCFATQNLSLFTAIVCKNPCAHLYELYPRFPAKQEHIVSLFLDLFYFLSPPPPPHTHTPHTSCTYSSLSLSLSLSLSFNSVLSVYSFVAFGSQWTNNTCDSVRTYLGKLKTTDITAPPKTLQAVRGNPCLRDTPATRRLRLAGPNAVTLVSPVSPVHAPTSHFFMTPFVFVCVCVRACVRACVRVKLAQALELFSLSYFWFLLLLL